MPSAWSYFELRRFLYTTHCFFRLVQCLPVGWLAGVSDQYRATDAVLKGPGKLRLVFGTVA